MGTFHVNGIISAENTISAKNGFIGNLIGNADTSSKCNGVIPEWAGSIDWSDTAWIAAWNNDGTKIKALTKSSFASASHSHSYLPLSGGTLSARITINSSDNNTNPGGQNILLNGVAGSTDIAKAPGIGFHIGNVVWSSLKMVSDGSFRFYDETCSNYRDIYAKNIFFNGNMILKETFNILLRPSHNDYTAGIGYDTSGSECIALWAKNSVTRLRWYAGKDMSNLSAGSMMGITPDFEISKASGAATGYIGGNIIIHSGTIGSQSVNYANNSNTANYINTVAGNEIRINNATGLTAGGHIWLGWAWASGDKTVTKDWYIGNFSGGGLANIYAKSFNGSLNGNATSASSAPWSGITGKPGGLTSMTLLWQNSSPSSNFNPQTISVAWSGFDFILVYFAQIDKLNGLSVIIPAQIGWVGNASFTSSDSSTNYYIYGIDRYMKIESTNTIYFGEGASRSVYGTVGGQNGRLVPVKIYGFRAN